jgi:predicted GIY-YIG superfamily endonuclease
MRATKASRPWELVHLEEFESRSLAVRRELEIKSWKSAKLIREFIDEALCCKRPDLSGRLACGSKPLIGA